MLILLITFPVDALKSPDQYGDNECELVAKDYQDIYGGYLIFIQPIKDDGAWDLGPYNGHFLNLVWSKELGSYYIDYQSQTLFKTEDDVLDWYYIMKGKKAVLFNVNKEHPSFPIIWHY